MNLKSYLGFLWLVFILLSCSGNNQTVTNPAKPSPLVQNPTTTLAKPSAFFKIGFIRRNFSEGNTNVCIYDKNQREAIVTFADRENGASLSFRMLNLDASSRHSLVHGRSKGVAYLSIGGEKRTNIFTLGSPLSICAVSYEFSEKQMQAIFECSNVVNGQGQNVTASGNWLCNLQTQKDWSW